MIVPLRYIMITVECETNSLQQKYDIFGTFDDNRIWFL